MPLPCRHSEPLRRIVNGDPDHPVVTLEAILADTFSNLNTNHEVPDSIAGSTMGIFLEGEDSHGDRSQGRLVEFRFNPLNAELNPTCHLLALLGAHHILHVSRIRVKAPPGTTSSSITTHTSSGQGNYAS